MSKNIIIKAVQHFNLITRHKWKVLKLCCKAGIPFRGIVHDLSKYSPTEFLESLKYYTGTKSPITVARRTNGYSKAWLHHRGRNKHHAEYWYDPMSENSTPIIPYQYTVEMVCDYLAASLIYNGKNWTKDKPLQYWNKTKETIPMNSQNKAMLAEVFEQVGKQGIKKTITKSNLKNLYHQYCEPVEEIKL